MAEKIDKNEYVDNSKVFFDFLLHTHQWSNITPVEYAKWLSNFNDIPDGQYIACRLLNRFLYYSDKDIKKLLVDAINDVYSQQVVLPLQLSKDFSSLPSENEYEINEAIKRTLFIPLTPWGDPGASGLYIMRCIHNYYKPRVQSCHVSEVIDSMSAPYDRIVIVDDFVGSGEQFADFWETAEIKDGTLLRDWCCSHQIQANYLALIGYEKTLTELESRFSDINISFAEVLDESHRIFTSNHLCWEDAEEQQTVRTLLETELSKYGIRLMGFHDLDFAVAVHDTIPDWSLPMFEKATLNTVAIILQKVEPCATYVYNTATSVYQAHYDSKWSIKLSFSITLRRILDGTWDNNSYTLAEDQHLQIYRGNISSKYFSKTGDVILHCSSTFVNNSWMPGLRYCTGTKASQRKYLNHGDIVINRIGRCAGYWSVYTGMQKLISDCLIVVKEPSDATIEALRNHSENGRLQIPLRGVSTPYITIDDVRSLLLNN